MHAHPSAFYSISLAFRSRRHRCEDNTFKWLSVCGVWRAATAHHLITRRALRHFFTWDNLLWKFYYANAHVQMKWAFTLTSAGQMVKNRNIGSRRFPVSEWKTPFTSDDLLNGNLQQIKTQSVPPGNGKYNKIFKNQCGIQNLLAFHYLNKFGFISNVLEWRSCKFKFKCSELTSDWWKTNCHTLLCLPSARSKLIKTRRNTGRCRPQ